MAFLVHYDIPKPKGSICICWRSNATRPLCVCNASEHWLHTEITLNEQTE